MKTFKKIFWALLAIGIIYFSLMFSFILSSKDEKPEKHADTLIILGTQVKGTPAKPSPVLKERLDTALIYLKKYKNTKVVVTGGKGVDESDSEANVMADYLIQYNIDPDRIIKEDTSTRTLENLENAQKKVPMGKTVIVSNDFHIYRAKMLAKRIGIKDVSGLPAQSNTSIKYYTYAREVCALGYAMIFDW